MPKTGKFPLSPKSPKDFRAAQMEGMKTFKSGSIPDSGFKSMTDDFATNRNCGPYGSLKTSGGGNKGNPAVKAGKDPVVPAKARGHMTEKLPTTKPPKGNIRPVRGEGPPRSK